MITLATYPNYLEANIVAGYLNANGIKCFIADENLSRVYNSVGAGVFDARIMVTEADVERATALLQKIQKSS